MFQFLTRLGPEALERRSRIPDLPSSRPGSECPKEPCPPACRGTPLQSKDCYVDSYEPGKPDDIHSLTGDIGFTETLNILTTDPNGERYAPKA
jgi:hypothetical protein